MSEIPRQRRGFRTRTESDSPAKGGTYPTYNLTFEVSNGDPRMKNM